MSKLITFLKQATTPSHLLRQGLFVMMILFSMQYDVQGEQWYADLTHSVSDGAAPCKKNISINFSIGQGLVNKKQSDKRDGEKDIVLPDFPDLPNLYFISINVSSSDPYAPVLDSDIQKTLLIDNFVPYNGTLFGTVLDPTLLSGAIMNIMVSLPPSKCRTINVSINGVNPAISGSSFSASETINVCNTMPEGFDNTVGVATVSGCRPTNFPVQFSHSICNYDASEVKTTDDYGDISIGFSGCVNTSIPDCSLLCQEDYRPIKATDLLVLNRVIQGLTTFSRDIYYVFADLTNDGRVDNNDLDQMLLYALEAPGYETQPSCKSVNYTSVVFGQENTFDPLTVTSELCGSGPYILYVGFPGDVNPSNCICPDTRSAHDQPIERDLIIDLNTPNKHYKGHFSNALFRLDYDGMLQPEDITLQYTGDAHESIKVHEGTLYITLIQKGEEQLTFDNTPFLQYPNTIKMTLEKGLLIDAQQNAVHTLQESHTTPTSQRLYVYTDASSLTVDFPYKKDDVVSLVNLMGQTLKSTRVTQNSNREKLSTDGIATGVYLVSIRTVTGHVRTEKVFVP